ncbi:transcription factor SRM1-like [Arachis duranensis]|uniref:Transcription factor SRM1-like n=1 Tax=Arachis duranensis TaxID=130453 RepID=A0A9C6WQ36_ARADU|nr:transcription factor SRM1-like [Arachis duranensis]
MKCHIYASKQHYKLLVDDVNLIESGRVTLPAYNSTSEGSTGNASDEGAGKKGGQPWNSNSESNNESKASRSDQERRKGIAWTKDEHMSVYCLLKYLENLGMVIYGCSKLHKLYRSLLRGRTMGRWLKDQKERKKQEIRTHNAQLHAAVSVAGIAAAVAAITASIECTL